MATPTPQVTTPAPGTPGSSTNGGANAQQNTPTGTASPISTQTTPTVISSKDSSGQFATNSNSLQSKTTQQTFTTPNGAVVDTQGNLIQAAPTNASVNADGTPKTAIESGASGGAGTGKEPNVTTGNPILDSLQQWEQSQDAAAQTYADTQKAQIQSNLQTNLANNDASFAAQIAGITNAYAGLITTQTRINSLNIDRTKAYGLASGNALATPLEFTNAVSEKETDAMTAIQNLDTTRDAAIAQAKAAQATGDAKLMQDSMDAVDKAEQNMQTTVANLASEVTARATLLNQVETQQKTEQAAQQQKMLAAATAQFATQWGALTDPNQQDALVKQIVANSGGMLDYGSVYGTLQSSKAASAAATTKAAQDAADLGHTVAETAASKASANASNASAAVDYAKAANGGNTPSSSQNFFSKTDQLLQLSKQKGLGYVDSNGYISADGFKALVQAAGEGNVTKEELLKQYGGQMYPGTDNSYPGYGLTGADLKTLTGIVTYVPPTPPAK